jgi:serine/threonine protein phosphatase PrpC
MITERTEHNLKKSPINITYSGSTEVLVIVSQHSLHCAVVGDSRAILATTAEQPEKCQDQSPLSVEVSAIGKLRGVRSVQQTRKVYSIQLTQDQKPNDADEISRIHSRGGEVRQLTNRQGKQYGPYRVWKVLQDVPGIAMSRSLGDVVATEIGVISTPIVTSFPRTEQDQFLVVASDGIWDVMDNDEVVQFVEAHRRSTQRSLGKSSTSEVSPRTVCIAQLLCEEARVRWLGAVEQQGVVIDDISCIVLEFQS